MDNTEVNTFHFIDCSSLSVNSPEIKRESESLLLDPLKVEDIKIEKGEDEAFQEIKRESESVLLDPLKVEDIKIEKGEDGAFLQACGNLAKCGGRPSLIQNRLDYTKVFANNPTNYTQGHSIQTLKVKEEPRYDFGDNKVKIEDQTNQVEDEDFFVDFQIDIEEDIGKVKLEPDPDTEPLTSCSAPTVNIISSHKSAFFVGTSIKGKRAAVSDLECEDLIRHKCETCHKCFLSLLRHKCVHSQNSNLVDHEHVHSGEKPFVCKTCGKNFTYKSCLDRHERIHSGEKPFGCKTCGKDFSDKSSVYRHERIHTGENIFVCKTCGKNFTDKSSLDRHERIHSGEKPFSCKTCGKDFSDKSTVYRHERIHTGENLFVCKTCGKSFTDNSSLYRHGRIHTGEKPFVCQTCGRNFTQRSILVDHERIHSGEKPFVCKTCRKSFTHKSSLFRHGRIHSR